MWQENHKRTKKKQLIEHTYLCKQIHFTQSMHHTVNDGPNISTFKKQ